MEKVEFDSKDQGRLRGLSKAIHIISKICRIFGVIGAICMVVVMVSAPFIVNRVDIKDSVVTVKGLGKFSFSDLDIDIKNEDDRFALSSGEYVIGKVEDILKEHSKTEIIAFIEVGLIFVEIDIIVSILLLKRLEKLFKNIAEEDSPFIIENVGLIKGIAKLLIASMVISIITSSYVNIVVGGKTDLNIDFVSVIGILIVFAVMYVFKYGCTLQEKSKKKIYE